MTRGVQNLPGQCLLVKCPDTARRSCRRKQNGKGGTCRICPECRCIRAAGGTRICLVRQILPYLPVLFSSTASNRSLYGLFTSRHCPARSRKILDFSCCIRAEDKASFLGGLLKVGSGFVLAYLSYMHVRSMYVGDRSIQISFWPFSMNGNPLNNTEFTILTNQIP